MGGLAIPTIDNAAAIYHNPAQLDQIEKFSITAVLTSILVNLQAPFAGAGSEQESGIIYAPFMFVGGAARIHERVTVGLGVYLATGFGGGYSDVRCLSYQERFGGGDCEQSDYAGRLDPPVDQSVTLFIAELAVPVQVSLLPNLSLGVALRLPWGRQRVVATQDFPNGNPDRSGTFVTAEQAVDGFGIPGVLAGLTYRPIPALTLAFSYRSQVHVDMTGTTEVPLVPSRPLVFETTTRWYVPHMVRVGAAYRLWHNRLLIGGEFKVQMHARANREQFFDLDSPIANTVARFDWKNVYLGTLAMELYATPYLPVRIGATFGRSASVGETLTPFSPPPGLQYGVYGGLGYEFGGYDLDFAFGWGGGPAYHKTQAGALCADIDSEARTDPRGRLASGGCAGTYDVDSWFLSLSLSYDI